MEFFEIRRAALADVMASEVARPDPPGLAVSADPRRDQERLHELFDPGGVYGEVTMLSHSSPRSYGERVG